MFQFKQFTIRQEKSAMKVCTDSCLFGAIVPAISQGKMLDIGTGTGLLALMLAQRSETAEIDAVEVEADTAEEATRNVAGSPWKDRVHIFHSKIQDFTPPHRYDLIICNPPFFKQSLKSPDSRRNSVMQQELLSFEELCVAIDRLLEENGVCWILLPVYEMGEFAKTAENHQLYPQTEIIVRNRLQDEPFRKIVAFSRERQDISSQDLIIYESGTQYSEEFMKLLEPYYLKL